MIRVSFVVPVTLSFAEGLLVFDWMYVVNRQCESREDNRKKQTERDEEYVITKLSHKEQFFSLLNIRTKVKRNKFPMNTALTHKKGNLPQGLCRAEGYLQYHLFFIARAESSRAISDSDTCSASNRTSR